MRYGLELRFNNVCKDCHRPFSCLARVVKAVASDDKLADAHVAYQDARTGTVHPAWTNDYTRLLYTCACGKRKLARSVRGKFNAGKECNPKCQGATGHNCECRCAGKNHGAAFG